MGRQACGSACIYLYLCVYALATVGPIFLNKVLCVYAFVDT